MDAVVGVAQRACHCGARERRVTGGLDEWRRYGTVGERWSCVYVTRVFVFWAVLDKV